MVFPPCPRAAVGRSPRRDHRLTLASDSVKTIPLRQLVREPLKVKRWTRSGQSVQITDQGKPLWVISP
jgi:hypothetical protein